MRRPKLAQLPQVWTAGQRSVVLGLCLVLLAGVAVALWREPVALPDPPGEGPRAGEVSSRLDPNTADADALAAVPGLGESRARAIVDYRTAYVHRHGGRAAFHAADDLLPIKGVGASTVENLGPYLTFPP